MQLRDYVRRLLSTLHRDERGQTAFLVVLVLLVVFMFFALAFDTGLWYFDHRTAQNQVDAASLAALQELPASVGHTGPATAAANEWLARNGYAGSSACSPPTDGTPYVMDGGVVYLDDDRDGSFDSLRVCVRRRSPGFFSKLFGIPFAYVSAAATATLELPPPLQTVMVMDDTGTMSADCNGGQTNRDCPIKQARDAATVFVDTLLSDDGVYRGIRVGMTPFRGCYSDRTGRNCVLLREIVGLTSDKAPLRAGIADLRAEGGSGTNVCWGMLKGQEIVSGQGAGATVKSIVILSDGDNTYNSIAYDAGSNSPPSTCRPDTSPSQSDQYVDTQCRDAQTRERELDVKTMALATALKKQGVDIYVVGYGVCGNPNGNLCNPSLIGGTSHDNTADRNLLKCIASSTTHTNDHYFEAPGPQAIPGIFENIAVDILGEAALTK
jgi:hypothetical protein